MMTSDHIMSPGDIGVLLHDTTLFKTLGCTYDPAYTVPPGTVFVVCAFGDFRAHSMLDPLDLGTCDALPSILLLTSYGTGWLIGGMSTSIDVDV